MLVPIYKFNDIIYCCILLTFIDHKSNCQTVQSDPSFSNPSLCLRPWVHMYMQRNTREQSLGPVG